MFITTDIATSPNSIIRRNNCTKLSPPLAWLQYEWPRKPQFARCNRIAGRYRLRRHFDHARPRCTQSIRQATRTRNSKKSPPRLKKNGLRCVIETGARFLLDPLHKHEPTLVSPDPAARARRIDFLNRAIDIAARLNADCVSLWSGVVHDGAGQAEAFSRLVESLPPFLRKPTGGR